VLPRRRAGHDRVGPARTGFLSGKYRRGERPPADSRIAGVDEPFEEAYHRRAVERNFAVVDAAAEIAEARGATIPQVALAWLLGTPGVTAPIIGPRTFEQLDDLLRADGIALTEDERARLEAPAGPPPVYPQRLLLEQCEIGDVPSVRRAR
jgi:aryl-alcohol dehydrogenase-like predicted oxidoreductase